MFKKKKKLPKNNYLISTYYLYKKKKPSVGYAKNRCDNNKANNNKIKIIVSMDKSKHIINFVRLLNS